MESTKSQMTIVEKLEEIFGDSHSLVCRTESVQVHLWPDSEDSEFAVVCTVGMSDRAQPHPQDRPCLSNEPRIECFCFCRPEHANVFAPLLLDLSKYPFDHATSLFWWQTLPLGRTLTPDSKLDALLFTFPPYPAEKVTFTVDGKRRDLVWVIPIGESERQFCCEQGIEKFEQLLESKNADLADIYRQPEM
jgi:hypothetical protein